MAELTTVARPYAIAAFNYAVENNAVDQWLETITFAAEVAKNETVADLLRGGSSVTASSELFINLCGDQLNENSTNFIKVLAENKRLIALHEIRVLFAELIENTIARNNPPDFIVSILYAGGESDLIEMLNLFGFYSPPLAA